MASLKDRIVEVLLARKLVTKKQIEEALAEQQQRGGSLQETLKKRGLVSDQDLLSAVSQGMGIPPVSLVRMKLDPTLRALISRDLAIQYQLIPVSCMGQTLTVAMADPLNVFAIDTLKTMTGLSVNSLLASPRDIRDAIETYYGAGMEETLREISKKSVADLELVQEGKDEEDVSQLLSLTQEAPVIRFTDGMLERAVRLRASDLLIEPMEQGTRIRVRIDGLLQEGQPPPKNYHNAVVSRIKVMSELNIAERRLPQDGHFRTRVDERPIDFRVSVLPSMFGEKIALRILDKGVVKLDIDRLGFEPEDLARLKRCVKKPHGLLLATGPTGSGKTTSLYGLLRLVDTPDKNIVTVEDPVEFDLEGINQVNTKTEVGLTFASALRSILRQDPDVIMVGEIRDGETADMAIKSALTGHLVLSTLHTNSAAGSIVRLVNMGVEPFLMTSCLAVVVGQRLVRKVCSQCIETYKPSARIVEKLGLTQATGKPVELARGKGCQSCHQTGYSGRVVVAEVLVVTTAIKALILKRAQEHEIEAAARKNGMKTLRENGLAKALAHDTTLEEVFRSTTGEVVE